MNLTRYIELAVLIGLVMVSGTAAHQRNFVWKTDHTLWSDVVEKSHNKARPHVNLGNSYFEKGFLNQAIARYKTAIEINPIQPYAKPYYNLGVAYEKKACSIMLQVLTSVRSALSLTFWKPLIIWEISTLKWAG